MNAEIMNLLNELLDRVKRLEKAAAAPPRKAWKPSEVSKLTGVSYDTVLGLIHAGEIGHVPAGRMHVVPDAELQRWLSRGITAA
ncbi:excisionase family DNA-binding protein [Amycolatopsis echigonensis]|uniref:Excisionase family DNA-binding protein n=1 Tax=Amycolatopsis echigonensis TaxID=2576905 RepID=A0A8E2B9D7_9PSEU|nr:helix-turn-helix domain-containing protein [Amycolatopsis echigonensis]MBB2505996.1 excisionase family DNA-binding protein [Amycolatopsis echigonensis]